MIAALLAAILSQADAQAAFQAANEAYLAGDHGKAAQEYRAIVEGGYADPDVYYNLGNAEFRAGRRGHAVLAYERALRLAPADSEIRENLAEARRGNLDKVVFPEGASEPLWDRLVERVPLDAAALLFLALHLGGFALLIARRRVQSDRTAFWAGLGAAILLPLALLSAGVLAAAAWQHERAPSAVVLAATAGVREAPVPGVRNAFEVHEGLKIRILGREPGWVRIRLPNGLEGWTEAEGVEGI